MYVDFLAGRPSPLASVELPSAVCSLVWTNFEQGKTNGHLFAGCVNGTVVICRFTDKLQFEGPLRTVGLGNLPVTLMKDGARVIACGSGAATFSWSDGRMQQSGLAVKVWFQLLSMMRAFDSRRLTGRKNSRSYQCSWIRESNHLHHPDQSPVRKNWRHRSSHQDRKWLSICHFCIYN